MVFMSTRPVVPPLKQSVIRLVQWVNAGRVLFYFMFLFFASLACGLEDFGFVLPFVALAKKGALLCRSFERDFVFAVAIPTMKGFLLYLLLGFRRVLWSCSFLTGFSVTSLLQKQELVRTLFYYIFDFLFYQYRSNPIVAKHKRFVKYMLINKY